LKLKAYEGMFLFDPGVAGKWETVEGEVGRIMERAGAELIGVKRWDERRLAYEIQHRKRACFVLTYFKAPGSSITGIERDAQLSELILRLLVLRSTLSEEQLEEFRKETAEDSAAMRREQQEAAEREKEAKAAAAANAAEPPPPEAPAEAPKGGSEEPGAAAQGTEPAEGEGDGGERGPAAEASTAPEEKASSPEPAASEAPADEAPAEPDDQEASKS